MCVCAHARERPLCKLVPQGEEVIDGNNALIKGGCQLTIDESALIDGIKDEHSTFLCTQPHVIDDAAHTCDLVIALNWK